MKKKFSKARWDKITGDNKVYKLETVIFFGKFKGCALRQLIESHPDYVRYLINECDKCLDNEAYDYLERLER